MQRLLFFWLLGNSLFVVLVAVYDPGLRGYANFVAGTVIFTVSMGGINSGQQAVALPSTASNMLSCLCCHCRSVSR